MAIDNQVYRNIIASHLVGGQVVTGTGVVTVPLTANAVYFQPVTGTAKYTLDGSDPTTNGFSIASTDSRFLQEPLLLPSNAIFNVSAAMLVQFLYTEIC